MTARKSGESIKRPSAKKPQLTVDDIIAEEKRMAVRISFDLTRAQHFKLKYYAMTHGQTIASLMQEYVDSLPAAPEPGAK
jgi:hypothetical protein